MDSAINSKTNEYVKAWFLETNPSYLNYQEDTWFADSNDILSYDKEKVKDITKIEVRYRKGCDKVINHNGTEYSIAPCIFILNKTELGINTIPESKEHKMAKDWIYNRIKNKKLIFQYASVNRPYFYENKISISDLDVDYNKIGIEVTLKNNKTQRADIIIPFKKYDKLWGAGIVIEIQFSKQYEQTTYKRSLDYAFKGFSVCWLFDYDFQNISDELIELKEDKLIIEPLQILLENFQEKSLENFRGEVQNLSRLIDIKMIELNLPCILRECNQCHQGFLIKQKNKKNGNFFYGCSNWKNGCKNIFSIINDTN